MADRIEKEIEEILAKLDVGDTGDTITGEREREPIPLESRRRTRSNKKSNPIVRAAGQGGLSIPGITPATLLFAGAGVMVGGLILASFWEPLIWLSFAGIILFLAAFGWSFLRKPSAAGGTKTPKGAYWRDRYIEYEPTSKSFFGRVAGVFRTKKK
jgi:hypothetical protein